MESSRSEMSIATDSTPVPAVELRRLTKRFGALVANDEVDLRVQAGTIHGIIGENGAGKSTAMKMLFGLYRPDSGEVFIDGRPCSWSSPRDAMARGIGMVHQHFMLAAPYSALDNILLGAAPRRLGVVRRGRARERLKELEASYGLKVDWERPIEDLPVGMQQRIELLKLLYREARVLILDEPTAVLTPQEVTAFFENLKKLRDQGKTIILVTHKLKEVLSFTENVTVFRSGKVTGNFRTSDTSIQQLADLMVGRRVALRVEASTAAPKTEPAIEAESLSLEGAQAGRRHHLNQVSFSVKRGEIVGVAGVEGNGQSELLQAVLHPGDSSCRSSGRVKILGHDVTTWKASRIRDLGVAVIPEDRHHQGLVLDWPVRDNLLLGLQRRAEFCRAGFLSSASLERFARRSVEEYDVRPRDLNLKAGKLSGGNQQKLIAAREFERQPLVLIAAQPTRGVDVGAIEFIHAQILKARDRGAGVLLISSELDEILALADRILVMFEGRVTAEFARGVSESELGLKMGGG